MERFHAKRLLVAADFMDRLSPAHLDMSIIRRESSCGTVACLAGWTPSMPGAKNAGMRVVSDGGIYKDLEFRPRGKTDKEMMGGFDWMRGIRAALVYYGLTEDEANYAFLPGVEYHTPKHVAKHLRKLVHEYFPDMV